MRLCADTARLALTVRGYRRIVGLHPRFRTRRSGHLTVVEISSHDIQDILLSPQSLALGLAEAQHIYLLPLWKGGCDGYVAAMTLRRPLETARLVPIEPNYEMLKALAGNPLILAASDEAELRRRYAEMLKVSPSIDRSNAPRSSR